jgi:hypothetical protein
LDPVGEAFIEAAGLFFADAEDGFEGGCAEAVHAVAGDVRVGVAGGGDDAFDAGGDEGRCAGSGAAEVIAWLERYVGCSAVEAFAGVRSGFVEGDNFGVV